MKRLLLALTLGLGLAGAADAQIDIDLGIRGSGVSIGMNLASYPKLIPVPGYPVYYDPRVDANYFFYDGLYWVFETDNWYASSWYNGPWDLINPYYVPVFLLRIPVRYYRHRPAYFRGWRIDEPPRWDQYWGHEWSSRRSGWNRWDRRAVPAPAPLPSYQRQYSGERYPHQRDEQHSIHSQEYQFQPLESLTRELLKQFGSGSRDRSERQQDSPVESTPPRQRDERYQRPQDEPHERQQDQQRRLPPRPRADAPDRDDEARAREEGKR